MPAPRGRFGATLAALALVAALTGCGDDSDSDGGVTTRETTTTLTSDAGTTATSAGGTGGGGTTGGSPPPASATGSGGGTPASTAPTGAPLSPGAVGSLAPAYLRPGHGNRIVVEVRAQEGAAPRAATLQHLTTVLRDVSGKVVASDGVAPIGGAGRAWTASDLTRAADAAARHPQGGEQVVLRLLFLHGTYGGDESVLGVAVRGDVAAVFSDQVESASGLFSSSAVVEDAVTMHETGHLLGLVDLAIDTGRADPDHPGHSSNKESVMYWAVESDLIGQVLGDGVPTELDVQDRADLARIRAS